VRALGLTEDMLLGKGRGSVGENRDQKLLGETR
jgi:hypothetical protein